MKKLLVVVDYQNDFVNGALGNEMAQAIDTAIVNKIKDYRQQNADVCFTYDTHQHDYMDTTEGKYLPVPHCIKDTQGWQLYGQVAKEKMQGDLCFEKTTFGSKDLFHFLENSDYTHIELCGVVSNICVISNAVIARAALPDAHVIVDRSCVASGDSAAQQACFEVMQTLQVQLL